MRPLNREQPNAPDRRRRPIGTWLVFVLTTLTLTLSFAGVPSASFAQQTDEDLVSARGQNPEPARSLGQPLAQSETPTGGQKKRTLSFTRRKKAAAAESPAASVPREKVSL